MQAEELFSLSVCRQGVSFTYRRYRTEACFLSHRVSVASLGQYSSGEKMQQRQMSDWARDSNERAAELSEQLSCNVNLPREHNGCL